MKKLKLHVRRDCPHCKYILEQLEKLKLVDKFEIIESNSWFVPAVEINGKLEPILGNVHGVLKLYLYLQKHS